MPLLDEKKIKVFLSQNILLGISYSSNIICHFFSQTLGQSVYNWCGYRDLVCKISQHEDFDDISFEIIQRGADINARNEMGYTPLIAAASTNQPKIVKLLLSRPEIEVNSRQNGGQTALTLASRRNYIEVIELLLNRTDIDVNARTDKENNALDRAIMGRNIEAVELLLKRPDLDVNAREIRYGDIPLTLAITWSPIEVFKLLLEREDIDVNKKDDSAICSDNKYCQEIQTPLMYAAFRDRSEFVEVLLNRSDIDVNAKNFEGETALMYAATNSIESLKLLLKMEGIEVNTVSEEGKTALDFAKSWIDCNEYEPCPTIVKLLNGEQLITHIEYFFS